MCMCFGLGAPHPNAEPGAAKINGGLLPPTPPIGVASQAWGEVRPTLAAGRYSAPLSVERSEEVDRNPSGQSSGQGQHQLHREPAVLPADFPARTLDLNPHPLLLDRFSKTTACHPPTIDRASHEIALAAKTYTKLNLQFLKYRPRCRAARAEYLTVPKKQLRASFPGPAFPPRWRLSAQATVPWRRLQGQFGPLILAPVAVAAYSQDPRRLGSI